MKKYFKKTSIALTIVMMFIPAIFGGEGYTMSQQQKFINDAKKYGKEQFSTSHIVVMPTASMCMRFVRHQSRALTIVVVHFLM